jgi:hypothetical protein
MCLSNVPRTKACEFLEAPIEEVVLKDTCYQLCSAQKFCPSKAQYEGVMICQRYTKSYRTMSASGEILLL